MESDSDSDGSHISATPPRATNPLPIPPPSPLLLSKSKSKIRIEAALPPKRASKQKPKPPSKPSKKTHNSVNSSQQRNQQYPSLDSSLPSPNHASLSSFPLPIRRPTDLKPANSSPDSTAILPAGSRYFSKSISFAKIGRTCPVFDSTEKDPVLAPGSISKPGIEADDRRSESGGNGITDEDSLQVKFGCNDGSAILGKRVKKPSNLIGNNDSLAPAKRPKCANEGNFVKLNINGHGRKFTYKTRKGNGNGYRGNRRGKRRSRADGTAAKNGDCDEDGLVSENIEVKESGEGRKSKITNDLIEEAVLDVRKDASDENLMKLLKITHGYDSFRDGQLEAIKMVLAGKPTMLVLPTGAGKSLCYQLPAIVLPGITLVVSPLVALMIDQLKQLPPMIRGAVLCSSQYSEEISETLQLLQEGAIKVLFISPERFQDANFISVVSSAPVISLVVIDEAHCISEWSHNFRPSYMRLRASILHDKLKVKCIIAMTATATRKALTSVMDALDIPLANLVETSKLRTNLQLSVSLSGNRMKDLITLIRSSPFSEVQSIIIYCRFQSETDTISKYLRDSNISAKSYHSGIVGKDRSRIQALFCSNKIRVVVATVAFGMGLDKSDVGAVIHYSLPDSLEEYVQEIGRAGRDGRFSYCHLLFDDISYLRLRSLMYSDGVDEYAVNRLLGQVFSSETAATEKIHFLVKESTSRKFDIKEEVILTILTQLELGAVRYLHLLPQMNVTCTLNFHKTSPMELAGKDIVVAGILNKSETKQAPYVFDIPSVANITGLTTTDIMNQLQILKSMGEVTYERKDPAYCYTIKDAPDDLCSLAAQITKWLSEVERSKLWRLDAMFNAAVFAVKMCKSTNGCHGAQHTACLQEKISSYFSKENEIEAPTHMSQSSPFLRADIKVFLQGNSHTKFTPRAVARIMHGIGSPAYPSATWSKSHFWGRYTQIEFKAVMEAAKAELMNVVAKDAI